MMKKKKTKNIHIYKKKVFVTFVDTYAGGLDLLRKIMNILQMKKKIASLLPRLLQSKKSVCRSAEEKSAEVWSEV
jgi:hypothetical protein